MSKLGLVSHGAMLADRERNERLAAAVRAVVRPGDVVVDVGTGSGLLAMLAARAGARKVYAVESSAFAGIAAHLVRRNGFAAAVEVVHAPSFAYAPPEPADVLLCETLGVAGLDEGFRATLCDARERMLRPGGTLLPRALRLLVAPLREPAGIADLGALDTLCGLDFGPLAEALRGQHRRVYAEPAQRLGPPVTAFALDCRTMPAAEPLRARLDLAVERAGTLAGFALWFEVELADGIVLASASADPRNHWGQAFLPLAAPRAVGAGERLRLALEIDETRQRFDLRWALEDAAAQAAPVLAEALG